MTTFNIMMPHNEPVKLWRYMDFLKFVDLLQRRALWFSRLDQFADKYEGYFPESLRDALVMLGSGNAAYGDFTYEKWRKRGCVNCWHMSEHESAAMWELYSGKNGLAICSRTSRLKAAIPTDHDPGEWGLYGNAVRYVDFDSYTPFVNAQTGLRSVRASDLHLKRKSFEHEREYRLTSTLEGSDGDCPGKHVPVCLRAMIEEIKVSPTAEAWVRKVVLNELKRYGLDVPVMKSSLYDAVLK